jgi:hypothetical protein
MDSPSRHPKRPDDLAKLVHEKIDGATVRQLAMIGRCALQSIVPMSFIPQWKELQQLSTAAEHDPMYGPITQAQVVILRTRIQWALAEVAGVHRGAIGMGSYLQKEQRMNEPTVDDIHTRAYDAVAKILEDCIPSSLPQTVELPRKEDATLTAPCPVISFSTALTRRRQRRYEPLTAPF